MKRIFLSAMAMFAFLNSYTQDITDSSGFKSRKLKLEEVNLVSSYYSQNGNNSAVTGGIGTEKLTDIANIIEVKLVKYDRKYRKHSFDVEVGIDHYTSASSDMVDLKANSSASHADTRIYPSIGWTVENEKKGNSFGIGLSFSNEFDYKSFGANIHYSKKTGNKNGEFSAKLQAYFDQVSLVTPVELRPINTNEHEEHYASSSRNSFNGSLSYSQIINERLQLMFLVDAVLQQGYLSLPFHRVYLADSSLRQENLPNSRFKIPLGFRANYFLGDRFIIRTYYRFYTDDWGLTSHTANIELPVKLNAFLSVSPFYRFYTQSAIKYFDAYRQHTSQETYYTSNYDVSKFSSNFFGAGIKVEPPKGVFGIKQFNMLELRYGHYTKDIGMNANIISMNLRFR